MVTGSNPVKVMVKRLHELLIHSSFRLNHRDTVVESFGDNIMLNHYPSNGNQFGLRLGDLCGGTQHTHRASALAKYLVSCHARPNP